MTLDVLDEGTKVYFVRPSVAAGPILDEGDITKISITDGGRVYYHVHTPGSWSEQVFPADHVSTDKSVAEARLAPEIKAYELGRITELRKKIRKDYEEIECYQKELTRLVLKYEGKY